MLLSGVADQLSASTDEGTVTVTREHLQMHLHKSPDLFSFHSVKPFNAGINS